MDARRADFEKGLEEEAGRPALIRQRLTKAKEQQDAVATQVKLPTPADEGPATAEARHWVLKTGFDALSSEIEMLDQELLSQSMRVDLLKARRDKAAASVRWVGVRVKVLEELVNRKRQAEAERARAEAEATRQAAEGKHPSVVALAEQNASLSGELALTASRKNALGEQTERTGNRARRIQTQFKSAKATIEIGGLSQELGQMLQRQRQALPDLRTYRRAVKECEDRAAEIGVRRLGHWEEESRLLDLDDYVADLVARAESGAATEDTASLRDQLRKLARDRKGLLATAIEADDLYLRKLGELESVQQQLLDAVEDYDAFLDRHMLWVRSTSLFELGDLDALSGQMRRVLLPPVGARWRGRPATRPPIRPPARYSP